MGTKEDLLRRIPSVEVVLEEPRVSALADSLPRWVVTDAVRSVLAETRERIVSGRQEVEPDMADIAVRVAEAAGLIFPRAIRRVVNATGIVIHTNLGRANLSGRAAGAVEEVATAYSSLEYDLKTGKRTRRTAEVERLVSRITGSEDAFVVNNNAAAVLLALNTLANGKEVIVSRGEQVEIGGSFRLPEVIEKSGSRRVEVGTTNRTRIEDYEKALTPETAVLLKVHRSNFEMTGYVESASPGDLARLAHERGLVVVEDLGSGALLDFSRFGIAGEPKPQDSLRDEVDVVTFSGDKLLGGPQAGIIVGRREHIAGMKRNPLARALRVDKMVLAALEETLRHYLEPDSVVEEIPTLRMIAAPAGDLEKRARKVASEVAAQAGQDALIEVARAESQVGGGSLPTAGLATWVIQVAARGHSPDALTARLRRGTPPIIARIFNDKVIVDLRTVQPGEDEILVRGIVAALRGAGQPAERS